MNILFRILITSAFLTSSLAFAETDGFQSVWADFAKAAAKHDKAAIQSFIKFPVMANGEPKQAGKFDWLYKEYFVNPGTLACLATAKPHRDTGNYTVSCGDIDYGFTKAGSVWRLSDVDNVNE